MTLCKLISGKRFAVYDNLVEGQLGISRRLLRLIAYREHLSVLIYIRYILRFCLSVQHAVDIDAQTCRRVICRCQRMPCIEEAAVKSL